MSMQKAGIKKHETKFCRMCYRDKCPVKVKVNGRIVAFATAVPTGKCRRSGVSLRGCRIKRKLLMNLDFQFFGNLETPAPRGGEDKVEVRLRSNGHST